MLRVTLQAEKRAMHTRGDNSKLRAAGKVPAVIYGPEVEGSLPISVNEKEFVLLSRKGVNSLLFDLVFESHHYSALVKELQLHVLTRKVRHIDFYSVNLSKPIVVEIPIRVIGDCKGVKAGGILEQRIHKAKVKALPEKIPNEVVVDVTEFTVGTILHIKNIKLEDGVEFESHLEEAAVTVKMPRAAKEEVPAEGTVAAAATAAATPAPAAATPAPATKPAK
jgi:large subunit ribosomal protein L25